MTFPMLNRGTCPGCGEHKFIGHGPLCSDCYLDRRPCKGRNSNICVAEGCYGEACLDIPPKERP